MTLTPDEVRNTEFRIALRGYAVSEVDAFLDRVEDELERLHQAGGVPAGVPRQRVADAPGGGGEEPVPTPSREHAEDTSSRGMRLLQLAEQTAEQLVTEAGDEAERRLSEAEDESARRRADAQAEAAQHLDAARREAEQVLAAARAESIALRAELSDRYQRESEELARRVRALREEVASLEELERGHRDRMVGLLTEQLHVVQREPLRAVRAIAT